MSKIFINTKTFIMKKKFSAIVLALLATVVATNRVKAQDPSFPLCIHDAFGYVWNFHVTRDGDTYTSTGTVDVGLDYLWDASGWWNSSSGKTSLTATNPQADGCQSGHTDSFTYSGTADARRLGGAVAYSGSGTWESLCSGTVINTGTWSATDCAHNPSPQKINPGGPARHASASLVKVSPNPINGQGNISYSVAQSGKVNITVYNSMQQAVKVLVNGYKNAGSYSTVWDTRSGNLNSGIYRVVAVVNGKTYSTTVQVIK